MRHEIENLTTDETELLLKLVRIYKGQNGGEDSKKVDGSKLAQ